MKIVIYLHGRRPTTGADAFDFFQGKHTVRRGPLVADAELLFAMLESLRPPRSMQLMLVQT